MEERRAYLRFNEEANLVLKPNDGTSRAIKAELVDISFIGIGVYVKEEMKMGTEVKIELITKLWDAPIVGEGNIKYVNGAKMLDRNTFRMGIEFNCIDKKAIQYILNSIQKDICEKARRKIFP